VTGTKPPRTLCVLQFHITTYPIIDIVFETVSAFSTCGMSTGYGSYEMPVLSKWIFYRPHVGGQARSDPCGYAYDRHFPRA